MPRSPLGPSIVDQLEAPEEPKRRLKLVLEVLAQRKTVEEACAELGIERARFYVIQRGALLGALGGIAPRQPGRPAKPAPTPETERIRALEARIQDLELELSAAEVREELALAFPWYAERRAEREKKRAARTQRR